MGSLSDLINSNITDETDTGALADAVGISPNTLSQILRGEIECPPTRRLEGFSSFLNISMESLEDAGNSDGCNYGDDAEASYKDKVRNYRELLIG